MTTRRDYDFSTGEATVWSPDDVYAVKVAGFDDGFRLTGPVEPIPVSLPVIAESPF